MEREECSFLTYVFDKIVRLHWWCRISIKHRPHNIRLSLSQQAPAYLGEEYPIEIDITNDDTRELDITVDILLLPSEYDDSGAYFFFYFHLFLTIGVDS